MIRFDNDSLPQVQIPAQAQVNKYGREVTVGKKDGHDGSRQVIIGQALSDTHMLPNQNFRRLFPEAWQALTGEKYIPHPDRVLAGSYALTLHTAEFHDVYPILLRAVSPDKANALMDLAVYLVSLNRRRTAALTEADGKGAGDFADVSGAEAEEYFDYADEVNGDADSVAADVPCSAGDSALMLFSQKLSGGRHELTLQDFAGAGGPELPTAKELDHFKEVFLWRQMESSSQSAYLCLSGPVRGESSEFYVCTALDMESLYPIYWDVLKLDTFEVPAVIEFMDEALCELSHREIECDCLVFDGTELGVSTGELQKLLGTVNELDVSNYLVKLPESVPGFERMLEKHGDDLPELVHLLRRSRSAVCGLMDKRVRLFGGKSEKPHPAAFFHDRLKALSDNLQLLNAVGDELERLNYAALSKEEPQITPELKLFIRKETDKSGRVQYVKNDDALQQAAGRAGFSLYAVAEPEQDLDELLHIFSALDNCRAQLAILKAELDKAAPENQPACFAAAFIAGLVRCAVEPTYGSKRSAFDPWQGLKQVQLSLGQDDVYHPVYNWSGRLTDFMQRFEVSENDLDQLAHEANLTAEGKPLEQSRRCLPKIPVSSKKEIDEAFDLARRFKDAMSEWNFYFSEDDEYEDDDEFTDFDAPQEPQPEPEEEVGVQTSLDFGLEPENLSEPAESAASSLPVKAEEVPAPEPEAAPEHEHEMVSESAAESSAPAEAPETVESAAAAQPVESVPAEAVEPETEPEDDGGGSGNKPVELDESLFFLMPQYEDDGMQRKPGRKGRSSAKKHQVQSDETEAVHEEESEAFEEEFQLLPQTMDDLSSVRKRGRPKGSKNKK